MVWMWVAKIAEKTVESEKIVDYTVDFSKSFYHS
jgi:hypothetical protein